MFENVREENRREREIAAILKEYHPHNGRVYMRNWSYDAPRSGFVPSKREPFPVAILFGIGGFITLSIVAYLIH